MSNPTRSPRSRSVVRARTAAAMFVILGAGLSSAGPLNPPPGAITSTYKTLTEVEPRLCIDLVNTPGDADSLYKITQPGSYYLCGNIAVGVGQYGIEVASNNVTIDLRGFTIQGVAGSLDGIGVTATSNNLTIHDGVVTTCRNGIAMRPTGAGSFFSEGSLVERVHVSNCPPTGQFDGYGIFADYNAVIRDCTATSNGRVGIDALFNASVESCVAKGNGIGILVGEGATLNNCSAYLNGQGMSGSTACTMLNCSAFDNTSNGLGAANSSSFTNCSSYRNGGVGIATGSGSTLTGCSMRENAGGGLVRSSGSTGVGFTVIGCSADVNGGNGFNLPDGSTIVNCSAQSNTNEDIRVVNDCVVRGCTCDNGATGIHATGSDNRLEGNNCTDCTLGIWIDTAGNIIIKNACSGNTTNWNVAGGNVCLVVQGVTGASFVGNTGGAAQTATDPNVNFTY